MKKAVNLIITYFAFLLAGILIGSIFYSLYLNVLNFISGQEIHFFIRKELMESLFYISNCMIFLICPFVCYYRIRHPGGLPQTIAYIILCLFTWGLLFPAVNQLEVYYKNHSENKINTEYLSKGYFREADGKVYYFTEDFKYKIMKGIAANTVIIDTSEEGEVSVDSIKDTKDFILNQKAYPYREVQIKKTFETSTYKTPLTFKNLIEDGKKSLSDGFITYLGFLSVALLICAAYALSTVFEWRLLNTTLLFINVSAILFFNSVFNILFTGAVTAKLTDNAFFDFLGEYFYNPLLVVINVVLALIVIVIGIIKFILRNHGKKDK